MTLSRLARRFNTVCAFYHDAYAEWCVKVDWRRCVEEDCRAYGWGDTLQEAITEAVKMADRLEIEHGNAETVPYLRVKPDSID